MIASVGTDLLASSDDLAIAHEPAFFFGLDFRFLNALHAVGAFLHHSAATHCYVRIADSIETLRIPIRIQIEVEAAHLVRAVIRAIAGSDATVVDHLVQTFVAMYRGRHRANQFAGRILAMHARHRLVVDVRLVEIAVE